MTAKDHRGHVPTILMGLFGMLVIVIIPYQIREIENSFLGPRFFPYLVSITIVLLSLCSVIYSVLKSKKDVVRSDNYKEEFIKKPNYFRSILVFLCMVVWIFLVPILGFILTTILFTLMMMWIVGSRNLYSLILVPVLFTTSLYYVFVVLLHVYLPTGFLS